MHAVTRPAPCPLPAPRLAHRALHQHYVAALTWAFTALSCARLFSYLPTMLAIQASGDSHQHSLWTWGTWFGANITMAAWLHEQAGQRSSSAMWVHCANALMCAATMALIVVHRH